MADSDDTPSHEEIEVLLGSMYEIERKVVGDRDEMARRLLDQLHANTAPFDLRRRQKLVAIAAIVAIAAALLIAIYLNGPAPPRDEQPIESRIHAEAPPLRIEPFNELLGPRKAGQWNATLPAIGERARVCIAEFGGPDGPLVRTQDDGDCPAVEANQPLPLDFLRFDRDETRRTWLLVIWSERPCGEALAAAIRRGSVRSFAEGERQHLPQEVDAALGATANRLICYRIQRLDRFP